jgi:beta-galactosidase
VIRDRAYSTDRITLGGIDFPKGLTTHPEKAGGKAYAELVYDLRAKPQSLGRFRALVGMQSTSGGSVVFEVFLRKGGGDWERVLQTDTMAAGTKPVSVDVSLAGATELKLYVTDAGDGIGSDHAVWAMARFE